MNQTITTGPVPASGAVYVHREFENTLRMHAFRRDWVLLLGPRQHGKTSALFRLRDQLAEAGFHVAFVDLQKFPRVETYPDLLRVFANRVAEELGIELAEPTGEDLRDLGSWLEASVPRDIAPVVIFVDEASAIPSEDLRHIFFGQMRALKNAADASLVGSIERRVQFIFAGTFRPTRLVPNELNSPFNVSEEVLTDDLTSDDVLQLATIVDPDVDPALARRIFEYVGGQPYLVQKLIQSFEGILPPERSAALESAIEHITAEGSHHTDSLFGLALAEKALADIVSEVALNGSSVNQPTEEFRFLRTIGLMKREGAKLVFRNTLYETLAKNSAQVLPDVGANAGPRNNAGAAGPRSHFVRLEDAAFDFIVDPKLREIAKTFHGSAVDAVNAGGFRVSMVAFGVCLEAILIDWLRRKSALERGTAITAARAAHVRVIFQNYETEADPMTWRLVNLVNIARQLNGLRGPLEVSEALRNMRNYVHPGKICEVYMPEQDMQPEAVTAGSLVAAVMRDIRPA